MNEFLVTEDQLLGGKIRYRQPAHGYRVSLEAPLLAAFALLPNRRPPRTLIDLASGPGAVALCLAFYLPQTHLILVEHNETHASLAQENLGLNGFTARSTIHLCDVRHCDGSLGRGIADLIVSNPPWFSRTGGQPVAVGDSREASRGLSKDGILPFYRSARQLLGRGGRFCLTAPASELTYVLAALTETGLVAKRLRWLHARRGAPAQVAFLDAQAGRPGGLTIEPPWFVREEGETYTPEIQTLLWGAPPRITP